MARSLKDRAESIREHVKAGKLDLAERMLVNLEVDVSAARAWERIFANDGEPHKPQERDEFGQVKR